MRAFTFVLLPLFLLLSSMSCTKNTCRDAICTEIFAMVSVEVQQQQQPAVFDETYTTRISTGERIHPEQSMGPGRYIVLDDSYRARLANQEDRFRFTAMQNGKIVVEEEYVISADCCHIRKQSGKDVISL